MSSTALAMLLADSRLPAGAHVSSNGLEPALNDGLAPTDVREYMRARAQTVVLVEAAVAVAARHAVIHRTDPLFGIERVSEQWAARTPSPALRSIARTLGAGLIRLATALWPESDILAQTAQRSFPRPVVLGVVGGVAGLTAADLARLVAYDDAQTVAAALLKLAPMDPRVPTGYVLDVCTAFEEHVPLIAAISEPEAIPAFSAPQIEEWAQAHSALTRRLFRA